MIRNGFDKCDSRFNEAIYSAHGSSRKKKAKLYGNEVICASYDRKTVKKRQNIKLKAKNVFMKNNTF